MFLSQLVLNSRNRQARRDLASAYELHRTLWRAFPDNDPGRIMFRVDTDRTGTRPVVLVQSDFAPQWERLDEIGSDYLLEAPEHKEFDPLFAPGQRLRFRLRANPTKKVASFSKVERLAGASDRDGNTKNGRRLALVREQEQVAWLLHKGEQGGFRIPGHWMEEKDGGKEPNFRIDVIPEGWVRSSKEGHTAGRFFAVRLEGVLEVTDPAGFLETVRGGIGSAKGFGFGLLSLARVEG